MDAEQPSEVVTPVVAPGEHSRVVATRVDGDQAYVLLDTGTESHPYLYGVAYTRHEGAWREVSSGNGCGWSATGVDGELGTWSLWDEVAEGIDRVRVDFAGEASEHPVEGRVYLIAWFKRPARPAPVVTAFRVDGKWVPQLR